MAGLLQRCEVEGSDSLEQDQSEESPPAQVAKRPATKTVVQKKQKKDEDPDIDTKLGACKGNDGDDEDDPEPCDDGEDTRPRKRPGRNSSPKGKKEKKEKKESKRDKKKHKKRDHAACSNSSESEPNCYEDVSAQCLQEAFDNVALADALALDPEPHVHGNIGSPKAGIVIAKATSGLRVRSMMG